MNIEKVNTLFFSATGTTEIVVKAAAEGVGVEEVIHHNITKNQSTEEVVLGSNDLLIVGMPVYAGRIPQLAIPALNRFKGTNTPAIVICLYGNRDYDDALLELKDIVSANGFKAISSGLFIGQHSIFRDVATGRPNAADLIEASNLGKGTISLLESIDSLDEIEEIEVEGNKPYREVKKVPLRPRGDNKCIDCGSCVRICPTGAIKAETPRKTDKNLCISCARCIAECPEDARNFGGILFKIARRRFVKNNSGYKENEIAITAKQ